MSNYTNPPAIVKQEQEDYLDGARADLEEAVKLGRKSLIHYKRAGEKMRRAKRYCKHGEWDKLVKERLHISKKLALDCRDIARYWEQVSDCQTFTEAVGRIKKIKAAAKAAKEQKEDTNTTNTHEGDDRETEEQSTEKADKKSDSTESVEKVRVPPRDWKEFKKKMDKWGQELPEEFSSWLISWMEKLLVVKEEASNGQVNGR